MTVPRWFVASVYKHFQSKFDTGELYIEFEERVDKSAVVYELRTNGPDKNINNQINTYTLFVNIEVKAERKIKDVLAILDRVSAAMVAFTKCIPIYKYGDDNTLYSYAILQGGEIKTTNMGLIDPVSKIARYTVEGIYFLEEDT